METPKNKEECIFFKQSFLSFANPKLHEAEQFSKILSKSLDPTARWPVLTAHWPTLTAHYWTPNGSLENLTIGTGQGVTSTIQCDFLLNHFGDFLWRRRAALPFKIIHPNILYYEIMVQYNDVARLIIKGNTYMWLCTVK